MKRNKFSFLFFSLSSIVFFIFLVFVSAINPNDRRESSHPFKFDQKTQSSQDTISALLFSSASDYFIYKGAPIGFQYELLKRLGKDLGKEMIISVESDPAVVYQEILSGKYDIVAMDYKRNELIDYYLTFSTPHSTSYPVIVGKKQLSLDTVKLLKVGASLQFPIHLERPNLLANIPNLDIVYYDDITTEELFEKVDTGEEDFIICDYIEAVTFLTFFNNMMILGQIGNEYERQWNLKSTNKELNQEINHWLENFKEGKKYALLCKKYFSPKSPVINDSFAKSKYNKISPYDKVIKRYAERQGLDWRFVSSIIYQETKFHTDLVGMGGSFGIMQLMPVTGAKLGVNEESPVEEQIAAGIRYLAKLNKVYQEIEDDVERMKFVAGAYNSGPGHINDAQRLCEKYGHNPSNWDEVAQYLVLKSKKEYIKDPVVKHGHYPGSHTVKYANAVYDRYQAYLATIPE